MSDLPDNFIVTDDNGVPSFSMDMVELGQHASRLASQLFAKAGDEEAVMRIVLAETNTNPPVYNVSLLASVLQSSVAVIDSLLMVCETQNPGAGLRDKLIELMGAT
ncbi:hypothetical protein [Arthrobacter sp. NPDC090010]|uniref:hypothetical protein n=1 Tax=Arthrobacter sp. NPDC090010 TaxID=3363942 RepID=UPI003800E076